MTAIVVGAANQTLASAIQSALSEVEAARVVGVAETTAELVSIVVAERPDVVLVDERLGPDPVAPVLRDLSVRCPASAALVISASPSVEVLTTAMEAGARGVIAYPVAYDELQAKIEGAAEWSRHIARSVAAGADASGAARGAVIAVAGAKGGVGTTTVAVHLALALGRGSNRVRTCLVDLDVEKGDIPGALDVRHPVSIADLAKVADDLAPAALAGAVVTHPHGIDVLLAPADLHDVEHITAPALRQVFALLRREYDVLVVDVGAHASPAQLAAVELADEVVAVVTPDVLALRALRRCLGAWDLMGVREEEGVRVLLNRVSRDDELQPDHVRRLVTAPLLSVSLPAQYRVLERAVNARDPFEVSDRRWWQAMERVRGEVLSGTPIPDADDAAPRRRLRLAAAGESGAITVETVGMVPVVLVAVAALWQVVLVALTFVWSGHAADAAARSHAMGADAAAAAREAVPDALGDDVDVVADGDRITVSVPAPLAAPGVLNLPFEVTSTRRVVLEP